MLDGGMAILAVTVSTGWKPVPRSTLIEPVPNRVEEHCKAPVRLRPRITAAASTIAASNLSPPGAGAADPALTGQTAPKSPPGPNLQRGSLLKGAVTNLFV